MKSLKVLLISTGVFPIPPKTGGAVERHIYNLANSLAELGHEVHVISDINENTYFHKNIVVHKVHAPNFSFETSFYGWLYNFIFGSSLVFLATLRAISKDRFDIIHCHDTISGFLLTRSKKFLFKSTPFIFTVHGYVINPITLNYTGLKRIIMMTGAKIISITLKRSDRVIVFSEVQKKEVQSVYGSRTDKIAIVGQAVDTNIKQYSEDEINEIKRRFGIKSRYFLYVGRLSKLKGISYLIQAIRDVNMVCVLVGGGPDEDEFEDLAKKIGVINKIIFAGQLSFEDTQKLYAGAEFFVLPTLAEGFPLVVLESMAHGLPVISTKVSGIPEVIKDYHNGFIVEPKNIEQLHEKIKILTISNELRNKMSENARKTVIEHFGWKILGENVSEIYYQAIPR